MKMKTGSLYKITGDIERVFCNKDWKYNIGLPVGTILLYLGTGPYATFRFLDPDGRVLIRHGTDNEWFWLQFMEEAEK